MKAKRTIPFLVLLLGLLVGREAQAFYNPSTGRWLSRDPIEEKAFYAAHSSGGRLEERRQVRQGGLGHTYGFVRNEPLSNIDPAGLRSICVFHIRATHFLSGDIGAYEHFRNMDWSKVPVGDAYGYISCGANTLNTKVAGLNRCATIPGMPRNNNQDEVTGELKRLMDEYGIPYDDLADEDLIPIFLDAALEAAKSLAMARCRSQNCGCCANIRITFTCDDDSREADRRASGGRGQRTGGSPKCGKSTTLDCKTGNFSMLR
jgi:hypothetical protein